MLSPANGEQLHAVNYVEDYLDSIESLPFDLQRNVSLMREIDAKYQGKNWGTSPTPTKLLQHWGGPNKRAVPALSHFGRKRNKCPTVSDAEE